MSPRVGESGRRRNRGGGKSRCPWGSAQTVCPTLLGTRAPAARSHRLPRFLPHATGPSPAEDRARRRLTSREPGPGGGRCPESDYAFLGRSRSAEDTRPRAGPRTRSENLAEPGGDGDRGVGLAPRPARDLSYPYYLGAARPLRTRRAHRGARRIEPTLPVAKGTGDSSTPRRRPPIRRHDRRDDPIRRSSRVSFELPRPGGVHGVEAGS